MVVWSRSSMRKKAAWKRTYGWRWNMRANFCRITASGGILLLLSCFTVFGQEDRHVTLPIGSAAPGFALPGVDGKTHKLSDYAASPFLAIVFTCNHCPTAQLYED